MRRPQKFLAAAVLMLVPWLGAVAGCAQKPVPAKTAGGAARAPAQADEVEGLIKSVDKAGAQIVVTVPDGDLVLTVRGDCRITLDGEPADLGGLKAGMKVTAAYTVRATEILAQEVAAERAQE